MTGIGARSGRAFMMATGVCTARAVETIRGDPRGMGVKRISRL
jgi:hypothetical protein